ncbi:hypothetical protein M569_09594, partial [Genlisea aurea]
SGSPLLVKHFSYKDIKRATNGFELVSSSSSSSSSSRGVFHRAKFRNGFVAMVKEVSLSDDKSFHRQVQLLACLHHRHIVSLCGFSMDNKRFLVFEKMERGTLKEYLSDPLKTPLNWRTRVQIAVGIAAAVEYLHFFCDPPVYRVSISSNTILLDDSLIPKISDIGLADKTSSNCWKGKFCCKDQECKDMIFQLGLVILELITGQSSDAGRVDLVRWIQVAQSPPSVHKMIDPDLGNNYDPREIKRLLNVARLCIASVDKPAIYTPQILRYLQKKIAV